MTEEPPGGYTPPPPPPQGGGYPPPEPPSAGGYSTPPPPPQAGPGGGYQTPPPQSGGYPPPPPPPPPQSGGYPPPPAAGYPPAGDPGYGGYGAGQGYNVGDAFSWAWNKFSKNAGPLIVATLVYLLIISAVVAIFVGLAFAASPDTVTTYSDTGNGFEYSTSSGTLGVGGYFISAIGVILALILGLAIQSAYTSSLLDIADGRQVTFGDFFKPRNLGNVIVASLILGVLIGVGWFLCVIPGLIVAFFTMFTIFALLDRNLSPIDAIKASYEITKSHVGDSILAWLLASVIAAVGAAVCYVGILVGGPLSALFLTYSYRRLSGGHVAPLTP